MLTVEEARERILAQMKPLDSEDVPLTEALGRVVAHVVVSQEAVPPFANSAMDGYAIRAADTEGASKTAPIDLRLVGEVPAGRLYAGEMHVGEAVRILTGAAVPDGADAVIQQELVTVKDGIVTLTQPVAPNTNIRPAGGDVRPGVTLVRAGTELGPSEIALLAAVGAHPITVTRRPRVALLTTGDELAPLGTAPQPGQIHESNMPYLIAAIRRAGGDPWWLGIAPDRIETLRAMLDQAREADLILTSGGVSVGDYDLVKQVLSEAGNIGFWRVRMRPGKPVAFGLLGTTPLLGLPGNPVSAAVTFELFGRPAIRRMLGAAQVERPQIIVEYEGEDIPQGDRRHFVRARLHTHGARLIARTTGAQDSHLISSLQGASALLDIPEGDGAIHSGDLVPALLLNDALPWDIEVG